MAACENCGAVMVIDEWGGWIWTCFNCDAVGRKATDAEIEAQEKEYNQSSLRRSSGEVGRTADLP